MVVQHNMQAMNANRMLNVTTGNQTKSTEKLSSGYKINRAADDAAGLSISEKMRKQIRGLDQASSNAEDGISAVQTAEGALTEVHSMIQRMNELAVQAANGTNSVSDRDAIQDEIEQLTKEIDRVAETTKFNEIYLLKGDEGTKTINLGAHDAGLKGTLVDNGDGTATFTMDALEVGDKVSIGGKEYTIGASADDVDAWFTANVSAVDDQAGKKVTVNGTEYTYVGASNPGGAITAGWYATTPSDPGTGNTTTPDYANLAAIKTAVKAGATVQNGTSSITGMIDTKNYSTGATAADGIDDNDSSVITKQKAYELAGKELLAANKIGDTKGDVTVKNSDDSALAFNAGDGTFKITLAKAEVANELSFSLHVGSDAEMSNKIQIDIETMNSSYLGIKGLNVSDDTGLAATYAIDAIADALEKVSAQRSELGAIQNRLEHSIANLDNVVENTTAAESRIRDTDMAEEMVEYSKNNILAQAGQSMLAQANQSTQGVMSLLQ